MARHDGSGGWRVGAPRPVGDPAAFAAALVVDGTAAALGLDLPLGLPRAWVAAARPGAADFQAFLRDLGGAEEPFWRVSAGLDSVSAASPFYPARPPARCGA